MVGRGETGSRVGILEGAAGRDTGEAGVACGQGAAAGAELRGGGLLCEVERRAGGGIKAVEPEQSGDPVYDAAGWFWSAAVPLQRAGGDSGGIADSQPAGGAVGGADRVLRQHAGDEGESGEREEFQTVAGRGEEDGVGGLSASGCAVRAAGGGVIAEAEPEHDADLPGGLCVAECAACRAADGGDGDRRGGRRRAAGALRPGGARLGDRWRDRALLDVQPGPV